MYVIVNSDTRKFVADPDREPNGQSYSTDIRHVRFFPSYEDAKKDCCGNEIAVHVTHL